MNATVPLNPPRLRRILETSLYAEDLDRAETFYASVLGLQLFAKEANRHLFYKLDDQMLLVFNPARTERESEIAPHGSHGPGHVAFAVPAAELDAWKRQLQSRGVEIEQDMRWPNGARSIYFRDPAKNCLELASPRLWGLEEHAAPSATP